MAAPSSFATFVPLGHNGNIGRVYSPSPLNGMAVKPLRVRQAPNCLFV